MGISPKIVSRHSSRGSRYLVSPAPPVVKNPSMIRSLTISKGHDKRINIKTDSKVSFFKLFTVWHSSGTKDYMIKSRTVIVDFANVNIHLLTGWQLGIMRNFMGLHANIRGSPLEKNHIFLWISYQRLQLSTSRIQRISSDTNLYFFI